MKAKFWVVCPEYVSGPHSTRGAAERLSAGVQCVYDHEVVESAIKPVAANSAGSEDEE